MSIESVARCREGNQSRQQLECNGEFEHGRHKPPSPHLGCGCGDGSGCGPGDPCCGSCCGGAGRGCGCVTCSKYSTGKRASTGGSHRCRCRQLGRAALYSPYGPAPFCWHSPCLPSNCPAAGRLQRAASGAPITPLHVRPPSPFPTHLLRRSLLLLRRLRSRLRLRDLRRLSPWSRLLDRCRSSISLCGSRGCSSAGTSGASSAIAPTSSALVCVCPLRCTVV